MKNEQFIPPFVFFNLYFILYIYSFYKNSLFEFQQFSNVSAVVLR